jgi:hypothetical protein
MPFRCLPILAALAVLSAGCGRGAPYRTTAISGRVTLNGQPLAGAAVLFQPLPSPGSINVDPSSAGITDADGRYTLRLLGMESKGAVLGKHKVRITLVEKVDSTDAQPIASSRQLPAKFNRETILEYAVTGGTDAADFELTLP